MPAIKHYLINGVTYWRIVMAPLIVALAIFGQEQPFKWLLLISFLTDAVDGKLARHYHIASKRGAMLDSLGDDLTVLAGFSGLLAFHLDFVLAHIVSLSFLAITCLLQFAVAIRKYGKPTAFHTILAKIAAVLQGLFLLTFFFWPGIPLILFYTAVGVTCLQLLEETIMVTLIPEWKSDVKGLYWYLKERSASQSHRHRPRNKTPDTLTQDQTPDTLIENKTPDTLIDHLNLKYGRLHPLSKLWNATRPSGPSGHRKGRLEEHYLLPVLLSGWRIQPPGNDDRGNADPRTRTTRTDPRH
ncbi:MAG TPA: CDP-alcohol phosphatidyltransferase family protein [Puia sp.]|nr:CDP-alcohol phosphatidyltransferase family protein [Puia sp.]